MECSGYLFLASSGKRLVTTGDFNDYLKSVVDEQHILNADGTPAHVTSHAFRHIAVSDRLRTGIIPPDAIRDECNHRSFAQTFAYGYSSIRDETEHLAKISNEVLSNQWDVSTEPCSTEPRVLKATKYERMKNMPQTRVIPGYGLCANPACSPRFENCSRCEFFDPDPLYLPYFEEAIKMVDEKIVYLKKKQGDPSIIASNEKTRIVYLTFIDKMHKKLSEQDAEVKAG